MSVIYTSTTGKAVVVNSYVVGVSPGLQLPEAVDELDSLIGVSLSRTYSSALSLLSGSKELCGSVPVIIPNSTTVATNGSMTVTALPTTYSDGAWVYLPAGAIVGGSAGYYWTVFSSSTVGAVKTNYIDPASEFLPYVPTGTLVAAVGSNSSFTTPTATDITMVNITVPANYLPNGSTVKMFSRVTCPNNANAKTNKHLLGTTLISSQNFASGTGGMLTTSMFNRTRTSQVLGKYADTAISGTTYGTVDTTATTKLVIASQLAQDTDYIVLEAYVIELTIK